MEYMINVLSKTYTSYLLYCLLVTEVTTKQEML